MSGDDARDVRDVAQAWQRAIVANDADSIASFTADDWVLVDHTGVGRRAEFLSLVASDELTHSSMNTVDGSERVRIYGDTAIVTARVKNTAQYRDQQFCADEWTTDVYRRTEQGWRCVLSHVTALQRDSNPHR